MLQSHEQLPKCDDGMQLFESITYALQYKNVNKEYTVYYISVLID